jgi:hypothetical protein
MPPAPISAAEPTASSLLDHARAWALAQLGSPPVTLTVHLADGSRHTLRASPATLFPSPARFAPEIAPAGAPAPPARSHSADFRSVRWDGATYPFTDSQAQVVRALWEAMELGTPDVGWRLLVDASGLSARRLREVFRPSRNRGDEPQEGMHPAWGTLIVKGATLGSYRLAP